MELPKWLTTTYPDYSKEELTEIYKETVETPYWKKVLKIYERIIYLYEYAYESKQLSKEHPEIIKELETLNIKLKSIEITVRERYNKEIYPMVWKAIVHSILYRISFTEEKLKDNNFYKWKTPIGTTKKRIEYWYRHPFINNDIYTAVNISLNLIQSLIEDISVWLGDWLCVTIKGNNIVRVWIKEDWDNKVYIECPTEENYLFTKGRKTGKERSDLSPDEGMNRAIKHKVMTLLCVSGIVTKPKFYSRWEKAPNTKAGRRIVYGEQIKLTTKKKIVEGVEIYQCVLDFYMYELTRLIPLEFLVANEVGYGNDCDWVPDKWM